MVTVLLLPVLGATNSKSTRISKRNAHAAAFLKVLTVQVAAVLAAAVVLALTTAIITAITAPLPKNNLSPDDG